MCGINGFNWQEKELLKSMNSCIIHRGPDHQDFFCDDDVSLGHVRLSIIDLSKNGNQPMTNEDGSIIIAYNGEVYNFKGLRSELESRHQFRSDTDTEVLIHGYEEWGMEKLLSRLNGIFAFVLWDSRIKKLFLVRDQLGVKPLYYWNKGKKLIFSSEIKAILEYPDVFRSICAESFIRFLSFRYNSSENTMIEGIKKVLPGTFLAFDLVTGKKQSFQYWKIRADRILKSKKTSKYVSRLRSLLENAVDMQLVSDVPLGVYLSGGVDSSTIVGLMSSLGHEKIQTYSVGFGDDERNKDISFARIVADHFGTSHKEILVDENDLKFFPKIVWHMDEPMADPSIIPTYFLSKGVDRKSTVVLNGAGGDEIFLGYQHYKILKMRSALRSVPLPVSKAVTGLTFSSAGKILKRLHPYFYSFGKEGGNRFNQAVKDAKDPTKFYLDIVQMFSRRELADVLGDQSLIKTYDPIKDYRKRYFSDGAPYLAQTSHLEAENFLVDDVLMLTDKMTMAHHLEARVPLLDRRIVKFASHLPVNMKMRGLNEKYIFKKAVRDVIPKEVITRKKQGYFVPIDNWFRSDYRSVIEDKILNGSATKDGLFDGNILRKKVLGKIDSSPLYFARQAWNVFTFNVWYDIFFKGDNKDKLIL